MHFTATKFLPLDSAVVEAQKKIISHYCNVSSWRINLILSIYDETKKRAHHSQIVRA